MTECARLDAAFICFDTVVQTLTAVEALLVVSVTMKTSPVDTACVFIPVLVSYALLQACRVVGVAI